MRRFAVIGLGHFGFNVAKKLYENGHDVIAIDIDGEAIQEVKEHCSQAVMTDASERENLEALNINDVDVAIVSLGSKLDASILITLYLKEMDIQEIVVKALSLDHGKILKMLGATEIIYPEKDMAIRVAERLSSPTVLDQVEFMDGYSVVEIEAPQLFWGLSLRDVEIRNKYGLSVILIKRKDVKNAFTAPKASYTIEKGDILVLLGEDSCVEKFKGISSR